MFGDPPPLGGWFLSYCLPHVNTYCLRFPDVLTSDPSIPSGQFPCLDVESGPLFPFSSSLSQDALQGQVRELRADLAKANESKRTIELERDIFTTHKVGRDFVASCFSLPRAMLLMMRGFWVQKHYTKKSFYNCGYPPG